MTTRTIHAAVMALALAAWTPSAHAGGGGEGGLAGTFLFDCYAITGAANAPQEIDVTDQFGQRTGVKLGKGKLLCTAAAGAITSGTQNPGDFTGADHIKCYDAPPKGANPKVQKVVVDPFVTEAVKVGVQQYVCVGAFKCDVGEACPPTSP